MGTIDAHMHVGRDRLLWWTYTEPVKLLYSIGRERSDRAGQHKPCISCAFDCQYTSLNPEATANAPDVGADSGCHMYSSRRGNGQGRRKRVAPVSIAWRHTAYLLLRLPSEGRDGRGTARRHCRWHVRTWSAAEAAVGRTGMLRSRWHPMFMQQSSLPTLIPLAQWPQRLDVMPTQLIGTGHRPRASQITPASALSSIHSLEVEGLLRLWRGAGHRLCAGLVLNPDTGLSLIANRATL